MIEPASVPHYPADCWHNGSMTCNPVKMAGLCLMLIAGICLGGCGGNALPALPGLQMSLSTSGVTLSQAGTPVSVTALPTGGSGGSLHLTLNGLPAGISANIAANTISLAVSNIAGAPAGSYTAAITGSEAGVSGVTVNLPVTVAIAAQVRSAIGVPLNLAMSTAFQPASWDYQFFQNNPGGVTMLSNLQPSHVRIQAVDGAVPETAPGVWNFSELDAIAQPVLAMGDHSPEFQIAVAPAYMYDNSGNLLDQTYQQFAQYCVQLVEYYNTGGFTDSQGVRHKSPSPYPITWWGIFNEPNINHLTASQYTQLYNTVVPAMLQADPNIKFVALELSDFGNQPQSYLPTFVSGVTAQVNAVATHYYATCNQKDTDTTLMNAIAQTFVAHLQYIRQEMQTNSALASLPIWVTENNVNADFSNNGISACNPPNAFVTDPRGTDAFFAAWRPYEFSQFINSGAGVTALYHWDFDADAQYGEVNSGTGAPYLSYWVDQALGTYFPPTADQLPMVSTQSSDVELLAAQRPDGSITVLVANHAVAASTDDNGAGAPRTVLLDVSALGSISSAQELTFDAATSAASQPQPATVTPQSVMSITLAGYGSVILILKP